MSTIEYHKEQIMQIIRGLNLDYPELGHGIRAQLKYHLGIIEQLQTPETAIATANQQSR